jgi:hypothetical protein
MGLRLTIRSLLWGFCLAIVLCAARSARAAAPMCDETASSRIAPPPVLPIRDVKLEAGTPCDASRMGETPATIAPVDTRIPASPAVNSDAVATEAWLRPSDLRIFAPLARGNPMVRDTVIHAKPGFHPGVFRPPRA